MKNKESKNYDFETMWKPTFKTITKTFSGHEYEIRQLGDDSFSILCLDPDMDDDGTDCTNWPDAKIVSEWITREMTNVDIYSIDEVHRLYVVQVRRYVKHVWRQIYPIPRKLNTWSTLLALTLMDKEEEGKWNFKNGYSGRF